MLVADDMANLLLLVSATSSPDRRKVIEEEDGDRAWQLIRAHRPTVALLDFQMLARLCSLILGRPVSNRVPGN